MRTWTEIQTDPAFHAAPDHIKAEARNFYIKKLEENPRFKNLPTAQQNRIKTEIAGDKDFAVKLAASLIAGASKNELERAMLEPEKDDVLVETVKGAKLAEKFLDVPLNDRPHEPFVESLPYHLDKPLRSVLGFIDDSLPEYTAYKFWEERKGMPLAQKIDNIEAMAKTSGKPPLPIDLGAAMNLQEIILNYPQLDQRIPPNLQEIRRIPPQILDQLFAKDPQAVLKSELPYQQWRQADRLVLEQQQRALMQLKNGLLPGLRPEVVPEVSANIRQAAYELIGRQFYGIKTSGQTIPIEPERIAAIVMASDVLGDGMRELVDDFPGIFSVLAGIAIPTKQATVSLQTLFSSLGKIPSPLELLRTIKTGRINLIMINNIDERLFEYAAKEHGALPQTLGKLKSEGDTALKRPLLSSITVKSEALCRQQFKAKQHEVRLRIGGEVEKALEPVEMPGEEEPIPNPDQLNPPQEPEEAKLAAFHPEPYVDPDKITDRRPKRTETPQAERGEEATKKVTESASKPKNKRSRPILEFLAKNKLSWKDLKKRGLAQDFKHLKDEGIIS